MAITYAKNSCLIKTPPQIEILGRLYTLVQIGNIEIMASDLTGQVGSAGDNSDCYYKHNKWYYRRDSIKSYLSSYTSQGWKFLDNACISSILTTLGGNTAANVKKMLGYFNDNWNGTNETGLNFLPYGAVTNSGGDDHYGEWARYIPHSDYSFIMYLNADGTLYHANSGSGQWFQAVRLYRTIS